MKAPELSWRPGDRRAPRPPVASGLPLLGNTFQYLLRPNRLFLSAYREHGPVFRVRFGPRAVVVLAGAEASRWVTKHGREFLTARGVYQGIERLLPGNQDANMVNNDGSRHHELRTHFRDAMSRGFAEEHSERLREIAVETFRDAASAGEPFEVIDLTKRLVYRQLGETMAGSAPPHLLEDYRTYVDRIINGVRFPATTKLPLMPKTRAAMRRIARFGRSLASEHALDPAGKSFTEHVIAGAARGLFDARDIPFIMTTPFVAGIDTLAHAMAFAIWGMVEHDVEWSAVVEELDAIDGPFDAESIRACTSLRAAVMESMRLYPVSPGQMRRVQVAVEINGYQLRPGDTVVIAHTATHLMEKYFPNPERFDLRRYDKDRAEHRTAGAYAPYGVGAHVCLGAGAADYILLMDLAVLLSEFDLAVHPAMYELRVKWVPLGSPKDFYLRLAPREARAAMTAQEALVS